MLDKLLFTCNAILPIILMIGLGYFIKRIKLLPDNFFKMANKLCFKVCLPVLLFFNIYKVQSLDSLGQNWQIIVFAVVAIVVVFMIGLLISMTTIKDPKQKGVILQCVFRSNYAIIGIALAGSLAGGSSVPVALASVVSAVSIPLFNILAIVSLSLFVKEEGQKISVKDILLKIVKNPLIIGVFVGVVVLVIRSFIPTNMVDGESVLSFSIENNIPFLYKTISQIAGVASPLALIALGGDFTFSAVAKLKKQIIIGTTARVLLVPVLCLVVAYFIGFRGNEFPALIALFGTPVAVSSVPMSAEMGNDEELAGQLVVWTSLVSTLSLFLIIFVCAQIGIFVI